MASDPVVASFGLNRDEFGQSGVVNTSNTGAVAGPFTAIVIISDAVFTSLTELDATGSLSGITIPAGVTLFGKFLSYQLASGVVRAHR